MKEKVISNLENSDGKKHLHRKSEEKISLQKFSSVDALKDEIRQKIAKHECCKTDISSQGSYISISFKRKE